MRFLYGNKTEKAGTFHESITYNGQIL